MLVKNKVMWKK